MVRIMQSLFFEIETLADACYAQVRLKYNNFRPEDFQYTHTTREIYLIMRECLLEICVDG